MKKFLFALLVIIAISLTSCRNSTIAQYSSLGDDCKVELVNCDGSITHTWYSSGKVSTETNSDGYYFQDRTTNKLVRISGNLIISIADYQQPITTIHNDTIKVPLDSSRTNTK